MDQNEVLKLQTVHKFNKNQFLKRTLQFVLSVSLFLLFIFYSSVFCFIAHSFNVYFPTFIFSLFNHTLETKYMFLICNGILVILAKSSASCSSSPSDQSYLGGEDPAFGFSEMKASVPLESIKPLELVALVAEREQEEVPETEEQDEEDEEMKEEESGVLVKSEEEPEAANEELPSTDESIKKFEEIIRNKNEEEEEMKEEESGVLVKSEDDQEEEPEAENEELNKIFEEFIRKMKKEIRIEG